MAHYEVPERRALAWRLLGVFLAGGAIGMALWFGALRFGLIELPGALSPLRRAELPLVYTTLGVYYLVRLAFANLLSYLIGGVIFAFSGGLALALWGLVRLICRLVPKRYRG